MASSPEPPVHPGIARALELILSAAVHQARAERCALGDTSFVHALRAEIARRSAAGAATQAAKSLALG